MINTSEEFQKIFSLRALAPYVSSTDLRRPLMHNTVGDIKIKSFLDQYHSKDFETPLLSKFQNNLYNSVCRVEGFFVKGLLKNIFPPNIEFAVKNIYADNFSQINNAFLISRVENYKNNHPSEEVINIADSLLENNFFNWIDLFSYELCNNTSSQELYNMKFEFTNYFLLNNPDVINLDLNQIENNSTNNEISHIPVSCILKSKVDLKIIKFLQKSFSFGFYNISHFKYFDQDFINFLKNVKKDDFFIISKVFS
jgi:hypothetical protein